MSARLFTDGEAIVAINNKQNLSVKAVLRELKVSALSGSNYDLIYRIVKEYKLDTSHWLGKKACKGILSTLRKDASLHFNNQKRINSHRLKQRLFRDGYKQFLCESCSISEWRGKPVSLELHHINGEKNDNRLENLQILCPNCHAQTETYCSKNLKSLRGLKRN